MAKTLKDLLLALLNATLILLALCLFLGWKLAQSVENIRTGFTENLKMVAPLRDEMQGIAGEMAGLRSDLATFREEGNVLDTVTRSKLNGALDRLGNIEAKLEETQTRLAGLVENPEDLINHAITTSSEAVGKQIVAIRGCEPPS
ncbi:hypothetical protein [Ruegeria arenilitoris]|uniref:hypothetical protein n=1 Tax=Ruegeria arenilitoris TaxID=1173585 RepID=UPI00147E9606|nr:hypothetical protein [Ruegeria arenilitoris]